MLPIRSRLVPELPGDGKGLPPCAEKASAEADALIVFYRCAYIDVLELKRAFHKNLIPRVRYLYKTELFKKLSGSIIAFNIAH